MSIKRAELIKERENRYWIAAPSEHEARAFAEQFGAIARSEWAGPGHYRSDVYLVDVGPRCNCESSFCKHDPRCARVAEGNWRMDLVGSICDSCAAQTVESGGGKYVHPDVIENETDEQRDFAEEAFNAQLMREE